MKKSLFIFLLSLCSLVSFADHIKGGWIYYEYLGVGAATNTSKYKITVKQYIRCGFLSSGQKDLQVFLGIFDGVTNQLIQTETIPLAASDSIRKIDFSCITNPPDVCYNIFDYVGTIDLPNNSGGYILSVQRCCRIPGIINVSNSSQVGLTYTNTIPGIINATSYRNNSSPAFAQKDTVIVCHNSPFTFNFSATDADKDSLSYFFIDGLTGGSGNSPVPNPPVLPAPPYFPNAVIPYNAGYSGSSPLGPGVTINSFTGIISGVAPAPVGTYVVAVGVNEYRGGVLIGTTRKEIHIDVGNCDLIGADPVCSSCNIVATSSVSYFTSCNSFTTTFANVNNSPLINSYYWDFGVKSQTNDTSTFATPTFTYPDTGTYVLTLILNRGQPCNDSTTRLIKIYPGFVPDFSFSGQCKNTQIQFTDKTTTTYGVVNSWSWNFGDQSTISDTSHVKNPAYSYSTAGSYSVSLLVTSNLGCVDTISKVIDIKDQPALSVTNDTLICSIDTLQLNATGQGTVLWTPNYNINNQSNSSPLVSPDVPTKYYVTLTDPSGCIAKDSVFVDVKLFVTIDAGKDTGICAGDAIQLNPISDALHYKWSPAASLSNDTAKFPIATPGVTTTFYVTGNIGKCQSSDSVKIRVAPYPGAQGIPDTTICIGNSIQFNESGGSMYSWSPAFFLNNPNIPNPIANPDRSIRYIVTITDTLGCPKPTFDTVFVIVQKVVADAGPRDTAIVINQPLQLNATGGQFYLWSPSTGLNNNAIPDPVAILNDNIQYVVTVSTAAGCFATDTINVTVYKVPAGLYIPNAFTPNSDGLNDVFRPIALGIKQVHYFKIYNRWGQLMFSTTQQNQGWDGTFKSKPQEAAVFVWIIQGVDYLGNKISKKGTVTLIR
jgi:gliding motility-associated-like protein